MNNPCAKGDRSLAKWRLLTAPTRRRSLQACDAPPAHASHPSTRPAPVGPSASGPASSRTRLSVASVPTWTAPTQPRSRLQSSSFGRRCSTPKPSSRQAPLPRPSSASRLPSRSRRGCRPTSAVSCSWRSGSAVLHRPSTTTHIAGSSVAPVRSVRGVQTRARPPPPLCPSSTKRCSSRRSAGATRRRLPALASPRSASRPRLASPPRPRCPC